MSRVARREEKQLFLQTILCTEEISTQNEAHPFDIILCQNAGQHHKQKDFAILSAFSIMHHANSSLLPYSLLEHFRAFDKGC